jgi:thiamine-phosphate pyrophosphorylase
LNSRLRPVVGCTNKALQNLRNCRLYGILDLSYVQVPNVLATAEAMIDGGVDVLQLRGKETSIEELEHIAADLHQVTSRSDVPLIVNDHAEVACRVSAEGVHVGQDDDAVAVVREKVGRDVWVGKSTHGAAQAWAALREGADYIGFGPIFATPTKPDYPPIGLGDIQQINIEMSLPIFCIGGIKLDNLEQVIAAGGRRVAIVSELLKAPDIAGYARTVKHLLAHHSELRSSKSEV